MSHYFRSRPRPGYLSCYQLTVETNTPLRDNAAKKKLSSPTMIFSPGFFPNLRDP
jgi:hypothetical protein